MEINRNIIKQLVEWKDKPDRKPLILQGIRQVGKTWLLKHFGKSYFENIAYFSGLLAQFEGIPHYWRSGNKAEIDFLIQYKNSIIPVEVKSDENIRSKSLAFYRKEYDPPVSIRFSLRNLKRDDGMINIPLFLVDYTKKLLGLLE